MVNPFEDFAVATTNNNSMTDSSSALLGDTWVPPQPATPALPAASLRPGFEVTPAVNPFGRALAMTDGREREQPEEQELEGPGAPARPVNRPLNPALEEANRRVAEAERRTEEARVRAVLAQRAWEAADVRWEIARLNVGRSTPFPHLWGTSDTAEQIAAREQQLMARDRQHLPTETLEQMAEYFRANGRMQAGDRQLTGRVPLEPDLNMSRSLIIRAEIAQRRRQ